MQTRENHGSCALTWCRNFDSVKLPEKERKYNGSLIFSRSDRRVGIDLPTIFRYGGLNFSQEQVFCILGEFDFEFMYVQLLSNETTALLLKYY